MSDTHTITRIENVLNNQRVRLASRGGEFRRVTSHSTGLCRGINITFPDGSSLTAAPSTQIEIETLGE